MFGLGKNKEVKQRTPDRKKQTTPKTPKRTISPVKASLSIEENKKYDPKDAYL